jgi:hypothetical protein
LWTGTFINLKEAALGMSRLYEFLGLQYVGSEATTLH